MTETIAIVVLIEDGRLMLGHRHPERRWYPDCWDLFGGHVEPGESPEQAARRECREEITVDVLDLHPIEAPLDDPAIVAHAFLTRRWIGQPVETFARPPAHPPTWFRDDPFTEIDLWATPDESSEYVVRVYTEAAAHADDTIRLGYGPLGRSY